ncbi:MAG: peptidase U32 family protein [Brevinema sp.]
MELLAPAGNLEKLKISLTYGADAAYIGGTQFNLRNQSANFTLDSLREGVEFAHKLNKRVFLTLNASLHEFEQQELVAYLKELSDIPLDAFIIADIGVFSLVKEHRPDAEIHISTQANVTNSAACKLWKSLGASRIVLARELSLDEIKRIKDAVDIELEVFVHGAVCMAYSGRCLLSNSMTGRDANKGDCSQNCRWNYNVYIEEASRPGVYLPVEEGQKHTTILSAKDLQMAEHLHLLKEAGVDSLKIEGRMKSIYYAAGVVRVYRALLDVLEKEGINAYPDALFKQPAAGYLEELNSITKRESDTGFFLKGQHQSPSITPTLKPQQKGRTLMGMIVATEGEFSHIKVYNSIYSGKPHVYIGPDFLKIDDSEFQLFLKNEDGEFEPTEVIKNSDENAFIKSAKHSFNTYDIIVKD